MRKRWLSPRALLLHLEVAIVAPGCAAAGYWQATRALGGNTLSWVYSIEWPVFALFAIGAWWHLIHEEPEAYQARKQAPAGDQQAAAAMGAATQVVTTTERGDEVTGDGINDRWALALAALTAVNFLLGIMALFAVSMGRPSGWLPAGGEAIYLVHALLGLPLALGAAVLLARVRRSTRIYLAVGWIGLIGVGISGAGGLLTVDLSTRFLGMVLMFLGPVIAGFGYLIPAMRGRSRAPARAEGA
ncbi:MAG: hypothetical protein ACLPQS_13355 [Acidimicrobiales bacterium]